MIANLKRNIVFIALALLAWLGYGDLDKEKNKAVASAKSALRAIEISDITPREPPADWVLTRDPYGLVIPVATIEPAAAAAPRAADTPPRPPAAHPTSLSIASAGQSGGARGPEGAATAAGSDPGAAGAAHARLHPPVTSLAHWAEHAEALLAWTTATSPAPPAEAVEAPVAPAELPPVQFTLSLQATLAQAGGGQARISGQTVQVGAALTGFDPFAPPVLRAVEGSIAVVTHRGKDYVLDLDHASVVSIGTPGLAAAASAAPPGTSGGMGGGGMGSGNSRSRSTAPPKAAGPAKATPATAPPPGAPKKAVYKARSYPGKPKQS